MIIALAIVGIVLTSMSHKCKFGQKAKRLPFHLSWLLGWIIGLLNCIVGLVVHILALSSIGGCDVVQKVQSDVNLFRNLELPAMLETCVFGSGDLMFSTGVTCRLKPIFDIIDKIDEVTVADDELSVCPMVFFFKSVKIPGTELPGHEDIYRSFCGEDKSLDYC